MAELDGFFREGEDAPVFDEDVLEDYSPDIVSVVDEDGKEHVFEELDRLETDGGTYVALAPLAGEGDPESGEAEELILLRVEEEDGEVYLSPIEDEAEFDEIAAQFSERLGIPFESLPEDDA
ncbi:MAG: DUF1292 domain-containing protein [Oscillospiraceae bacterium]|jgi:uncharacterized protein YrzB (UPF0473 family)|nr:DUF1292 domain-containing protein [Oscillospiraceae bacterium]